VDVGESGTNVVPVVNGFVVRSAVRSVPIGEQYSRYP
jgi:actin-related protein